MAFDLGTDHATKAIPLIAEARSTIGSFAAMDEAVRDLVRAATDLSEHDLNTVPYTYSWTAGQLLRHVTKATVGMAQALEMHGTPANRDSGARIPPAEEGVRSFQQDEVAAVHHTRSAGRCCISCCTTRNGTYTG